MSRLDPFFLFLGLPQVRTDHLISMGAEEITREAFLKVLQKAVTGLKQAGLWL